MYRFIIGSGIVVLFAVFHQNITSQGLAFDQVANTTLICLSSILGGAILAIFGLRKMIRRGDLRPMLLAFFKIWTLITGQEISKKSNAKNTAQQKVEEMAVSMTKGPRQNIAQRKAQERKRQQQGARRRAPQRRGTVKPTV